jgi:hypothetical protein
VRVLNQEKFPSRLTINFLISIDFAKPCGQLMLRRNISEKRVSCPALCGPARANALIF